MKSVIKRGLIWFFLIVLTVSVLNPLPIKSQSLALEAQSGSPIIQHYSPKEYNAYPQNWSIVQDQRGIIYIGNNGFVLEYDGTNWRKIFIGDEMAVRALTVDKKGTIFIGAVGELGYLAPDSTGQMEFVSLKEKIPEKHSVFTDIWKACATSQAVFFFTREKFFRLQNDQIDVIEEPLDPMFAEVVNDTLFVFLHNKGIARLEGTKFKLLPGSDSIMKDAGRTLLLSHAANSLLIITTNKGIYTYDYQSPLPGKTISPLQNLAAPVAEYLKRHLPYCGSVLLNGRYAIGTLMGGILLLDQDGQLVRVINKNRGLSPGFVLSLYEDNSRNLWAGLNDSIARIETNSPINHLGEFEGLKGIPVTVISYKQQLYIGTTAGAFTIPEYQFNVDNDQLEIKPLSKINFDCFGFFKLHGHLYATSSSNIVQIDGHETKTPFDTEKFIYCVGISSRFPDKLFLGQINGFTAFHAIPGESGKNTPAISFIKDPAFDSITYQIRRIEEDHTGQLWLSTATHGVIRIRFTGPELKDHQIDHYGVEQGLPSNSANRIFFWQNQLLVATVKGFYTDLKNTSSAGSGESIHFTPATKINAVFGSTIPKISNISVENNHILWLGANEQVSRIITGDDQQFIWEHENWRKVSGQFEHVYHDTNGLTWIATSEGLFSYNAQAPISDTSTLQTNIRRVFFGKDKELFGEQTQNQVIKYKDNSATFDFSMPFFNSSLSNQYRHLLKGFDNEWSNWDKNTRAVYTNLPTKEFQFIVEGRNYLGQTSRQGTYRFVITPPWHGTLLANIIKGLLAFFLVVLVVWLNSRRLIVAQKKLERIVNERTAEVIKQKEEIQHQAKILKMTNQELEKLSIVARETNNGVLITSAEGEIQWVNDGFMRMYGLSQERLFSEMGKNIYRSSTRNDLTELIKECIDTRKPVVYESSAKKQTGETIWIQTAMTPIADESGRITRLVFVETEITALKQAYERMEQMSLTDPLTHLNNRRYFHNLIDRDIQIAKRKAYRKNKKEATYAMMFLIIDIDHFKTVNDRYGHQAGDHLLIEVSRRMKETLRASDLIVRWGGEEFLVMIKDDDFEGALNLSKKLLDCIGSTGFQLLDNHINVTISIGYCGLPIMIDLPDCLKWEDAVNLADAALYIAKGSGRNRSVGINMEANKLTSQICRQIKENFQAAIDSGLILLVHSHKPKPTSTS